MTTDRSILHVDMDAFFASVEQLDFPFLRNQPVLVGHDGPRGVVTTASYEARPFGCHSAQPMAMAKRLCRHAIVRPVRGARYQELASRFFSILEAFSPLVEPISIDEAFLDLAGTGRLVGNPQEVAKQLRQRIRKELGLTASVGIAPNKFLAKLASDLNKPDGLTIIGDADVDTVLPPLPVTKIWGIGPAMAARLAGHGIGTISDLRNCAPQLLKQLCGVDAERFSQLARGIDHRHVTPDHEAKSLGHEQTFEVDLPDVDEVRRVLIGQVEQVARRLRKHGFEAHGLTIKIRYGNFKTINRSATLERSTDTTGELWRLADSLFSQWAGDSFQPVRLIGVSISRLTKGETQGTLFSDAAQKRMKRVDETSDRIVEKFGKTAVRRAATLPARSGDGVRSTTKDANE